MLKENVIKIIILNFVAFYILQWILWYKLHKTHSRLQMQSFSSWSTFARSAKEGEGSVQGPKYVKKLKM